MPNLNSAKKALRQNVKRKIFNLRFKNQTKKLIKETKILITKKDKESAQANLAHIYKKLDKMAKQGIIKKNKAARKKSRLTKMINQLN